MGAQGPASVFGDPKRPRDGCDTASWAGVCYRQPPSLGGLRCAEGVGKSPKFIPGLFPFPARLQHAPFGHEMRKFVMKEHGGGIVASSRPHCPFPHCIPQPKLNQSSSQNPKPSTKQGRWQWCGVRGPHVPGGCGVQRVPHGSGTAVWGGMGRYGVVGGLLRLVLVPRQHRGGRVHELRGPFCERSLLAGRGESGVTVWRKPNPSKTAPKPQRRVLCVTKRFVGRLVRCGRR